MDAHKMYSDFVVIRGAWKLKEGMKRVILRNTFLFCTFY